MKMMEQHQYIIHRCRHLFLTRRSGDAALGEECRKDCYILFHSHRQIRFDHGSLTFNIEFYSLNC
jgi:hypothetical protein